MYIVGERVFVHTQLVAARACSPDTRNGVRFQRNSFVFDGGHYSCKLQECHRVQKTSTSQGGEIEVATSEEDDEVDEIQIRTAGVCRKRSQLDDSESDETCLTDDETKLRQKKTPKRAKAGAAKYRSKFKPAWTMT